MAINKKITLFYFSSTGNSLKAAMDIAAKYATSDLVAITENTTIRSTNSSVVGFVFPVYMGTLPKIVESFLLQFQFLPSVYYFAITTYYGYQGCTLAVANKILKDRGAHLNYSNAIQTVGNCLMEYQVSAKKRISLLKHANQKSATIALDIAHLKERKTAKYHRFSESVHKWLFDLFFKKAYQKFTLEDNCINCGICVKVCPVNNISIAEQKPRWDQKCIACHACVHWCPKNSINLGRSKGRLQYHNPDIKVASFFRS